MQVCEALVDKGVVFDVLSPDKPGPFEIVQEGCIFAHGGEIAFKSRKFL